MFADEDLHRHAVENLEQAVSAFFTARLRAGFRFSVNVDGNQDAKWGGGAYDAQRRGVPPANDDFSYALGASKGCPQYILWGYPRNGVLELRQENADGLYVTSPCGVFASSFTVETTPSDRPGFVSTVYKIPKNELFGKRSSAHVLLELLDDTGRHGYYSLAHPLIIER